MSAIDTEVGRGREILPPTPIPRSVVGAWARSQQIARLERCASLPFGSCPMATAAALPGPGAASPGEAYSGSRKSAQRFEYSVHSTAGFVELAPSSFGAASWDDRFVAAKEFFSALTKVPGVAKVSDLHWAHFDLHLVLQFCLLSGASFDLHCDWHRALLFDFHWD